jgi:hypothetical protein
LLYPGQKDWFFIFCSVFSRIFRLKYREKSGEVKKTEKPQNVENELSLAKEKAKKG